MGMSISVKDGDLHSMKPTALKPIEIPLNIVGGNKYGRYPKISDEKTFNMIVSDDFLVNYAGYEVVASINPSAKGRAIYTSTRWGNMLAVIGNGVYGLTAHTNSNQILPFFFIGFIDTFEGDVFVDENIAGEIAICDGVNIYIFNWANPTNPALIAVELPIDPRTSFPIVPGYITYQDGYFLTVNEESASWFLSAPNQGTLWMWSATDGPVTTSIQTKPTNAVAVLRAPSRGNLLYVFGTNVTEMWYDVGAAIFPYQRSTSVSVDYGCLSPSTIAAMDSYVAWLGSNERSGPVIMISEGADIDPISNDGINFKLSTLVNPKASYGFFFKQDGHLFYQITFTDPEDNFTLVYDFNTKLFFNASDEFMNYHIAERVAFFDDSYYFVSINDGNIYRTTSELTTYNYTLPMSTQIEEYEIPRVRVCSPIRMQDSSRFVINNATFTIEQGVDDKYKGNNPNFDPQPYVPRIDMSISKNGAESFSSYINIPMNPLGIRKNRVVFWQLGSANDATLQFRFWSKNRIVATNGLVSIYQ